MEDLTYIYERIFDPIIQWFSVLQTICQKTPDKTAEYFAAVWSLHAISKVQRHGHCTHKRN